MSVCYILPSRYGFSRRCCSEYKEIGEKRKISTKIVENQADKAIRKLKDGAIKIYNGS